MNSSPEYASFLLRLWREPATPGVAAVQWRGEIIHIQSGARCELDSLAVLAAFLRQESGDANLLAAAGRNSEGTGMDPMIGR